MKPIAFMKGRFVAAAISGVLLLATVVSLSLQQLNWGLDFTGGTLIELNYDSSATLAIFVISWLAVATRVQWWSVLVLIAMYWFGYPLATPMPKAPEWLRSCGCDIARNYDAAHGICRTTGG